MSTLRVLMLTSVAVTAPAQGAPDCTAYSKEILGYLAKATADAAPIAQPNKAESSTTELCYVSLTQNASGFIDQLNIARCPQDSRTTIGSALLKAQPLPKPANPECRANEIRVSIQRWTEITTEVVPGTRK